MNPVVTIGIPVYKRLHCLPRALQSVAAQDYPYIELIVSDNGMNGNKVKEIAEKWYPRPFRFRQNTTTVNVSAHYNQIIQEASGEYFAMLDDDDVLGPRWVSELLSILNDSPEVAIAMAQQEAVDASGTILARSSPTIPDYLTAEEFFKTWSQWGFTNYTTFLSRTNALRQCAGYPDYPRGFHIEDAVIIKLSVGHKIAFSKQCVFRLLRDESSMVSSINIQELAEATRLFLKFLDTDPLILEHARCQPDTWKRSKEPLVTAAWQTYFHKWNTVFRQKMSLGSWMKAGMVGSLMRISAYRSAVRSAYFHAIEEWLILALKRHMPWVVKVYQALASRSK